MTNDKMVNDSMELRIREVAQQLFFEQGYANTLHTAKRKSSAWSKRFLNRKFALKIDYRHEYLLF